jgi:hypothetical protein
MKIFKTRENKLKNKIINELNGKPNIDNIMNYIHEYEKDNLETINKLKRDKLIETKKISGALKQTINAHGSITKELIGSATKRIMGSLLDSNKKESKFKRFLKWIKKLKKYCCSILMGHCV